VVDFTGALLIGFENSLPLSVRITGKSFSNPFIPRTSYSRLKILITEADVFVSLKNASIRLVLTKCMVSRHLPPMRSITESVWTILDFSQEINIPDIKKTGINIVI